VRERWVCPKCGHTEDLLVGTKFYEHFYKKGIVCQVHEMKKEKKDE
jgi:transposase-like protein